MKFDALKSLSGENREYILQEAAYVAENMSSRVAGSVAEADAADHFAEKLRAAGAEVKTEEFNVAPAAAFGWIGVTAVCMMLAFVAYFFVSLVSVALIVVALIPFIVQGVMMSRAFDGAYIKRTSRNVTALLPCSGEVKSRVYFTAHLDAAHIFRPTAGNRMKWVLAVIVLSLIGVAYLFAADIARWSWLGSVGTGLAADEWLIVGLVGIVFVPFWMAALFLIDGRTASIGAGDDLSGCCVATAFMKALGESGLRPEHTEVGVILTGSEECGLRGSKVWCDAHAAECGDVDTFFVTLDTLRDLDFKSPYLIVMNKCDKAAERELFPPDCVCISARTGEGIEELKRRILQAFSEHLRAAELFVPYDKISDYNRIRHRITERKTEYTDDGIRIDAVIPEECYAACKPFLLHREIG